LAGDEKVNRKLINCPHCGKILSEDLWKEKKCENQKSAVKCPQCGSQKAWKDGKRQTPQGTVQRYLCRECSYRFSKQ
jgi:transposase-like protein